MTTSSKVRSDIQNLLDMLFESRIAWYVRPAVVQQERDRVRVTWKPATSSNRMLASHEFGSIDYYLEAMRTQAFSALLSDGSIIQLSIEIENNSVAGHRFVFIPCPVKIKQEIGSLEGFVESIEDALTSSVIQQIRRPPLRFDFDIEESARHTTSHVHLGYEDCRIAISHPLSLGDFVRFVFHYFYLDWWKNLQFLQDWPLEDFAKCIRPQNARLLHLSRLRQ